MNKIAQTIAVFFIVAFSLQTANADEGMFPISEIARLNLAEKGLKLTPEEVFNSNKTCLVDGICRVNGCTGSFVSPNGLIITNHHCAYRAIQSASTVRATRDLGGRDLKLQLYSRNP